MRPRVLRAFDDEERRIAYELLARKVATMGSRKFEEGDWADIYCEAKGIPAAGWSNLNLDVMYEGLGIEHKMLGTAKPPAELCGQRLMHPALTRSIRVPPPSSDAEEAKDDVLGQYAALVEARREAVRQTAANQADADLRTGWLLWQRDLSQFMYFEEELLAPDSADYCATWKQNQARGSRKATDNLWIFEKDTDVKRYSVTGSGAGSKIQPYFDVPPRGTNGLYIFTIQGEDVGDGLLRTWVTESTYFALQEALGGDVTTAPLSEAVDLLDEAPADPDDYRPPAREVRLEASAYLKLKAAFPANTDDERIQMLVQYLVGS
jgi:hypothetical protein